MFERYTEKARRAIFFGRHEASQFGSPYIETEHLLLGMLRDNPHLVRLLPAGSVESIRAQINANSPARQSVPTSVDLPLSNEGKRSLAYAAEEAERLGHRHIGSEHLFMGLLRENRSFAAALLQERGVSLPKLRERFASADDVQGPEIRGRLAEGETRIQIHGISCSAETIRERVNPLREFNWYWQKQTWKAHDLAVGKDGKASFNASLAKDRDSFTLSPGGWRKDQCRICNWELCESDDPQHNSGHSNGRDWVCTECYEKFLQGPDYFASSHADIT